MDDEWTTALKGWPQSKQQRISEVDDLATTECEEIVGLMNVQGEVLVHAPRIAASTSKHDTQCSACNAEVSRHYVFVTKLFN